MSFLGHQERFGGRLQGFWEGLGWGLGDERFGRSFVFSYLRGPGVWRDAVLSVFFRVIWRVGSVLFDELCEVTLGKRCGGGVSGGSEEVSGRRQRGGDRL